MENVRFNIGGLLFALVISMTSVASCQNATKIPAGGDKDSFHCIIVPSEQLDFFRKQPPIQFWQKVILLTKDSCIVVHKDSRNMMDVISAKRLDSLVDYAKLEVTAQCYRDSFGYETCELVKFVRGKREFFDFKKVGPLVDDAKKVFNEIGVNPIYAQFILLIESPNNPRARSISGAVGHYQLMPFVAKKYGLVITSARDDRHDFALSSMAAAKLMRDYCIPNAQRMAVSVGLEPDLDQLWFQLLVMHVYNAGAGNVRKAVAAVGEVKSGEELIMKLWKTQAGAFGNSSQNYSQLALASYINYLDWLRAD
ncbi:MAG: hypothetical protein RL747_1697 [Bacteroidota bacterium]|jgi:hypothetical protein